jgi:DNA-binding SARP family transcriptional activator
MPSHSPNQTLQLMLLGGFDARLSGCPVAGITYNKMRALLAYLAVERERDHNREVLAALLWSDNNPTTARGNLRRTLSDLRRVLELPTGTTLFSASKHSIRFIPNAYIDVLDFAGQTPALSEEKIIALYRGEFLAGLSLPDSPDFEDWLQIQRETLHRRALALLEQLSNHHEQVGDYSKALQFALRYTELEPWDEDAHRRVMRLYTLNGQNSTAITQYEACCRLLKKELGALPSEETRHLAERIRNGELGRESPAAVEAPPPFIPQQHAERRQVTVLYCELSLAAIDDPDEAMELLRAPQARCVEIIRQFSGHIVQTHGGGLLAYFGYPQAHEDAARRAVQAALAITREAAYGIEIRTGVHTGLIITGGESSVPDTVGQTSRFAIQLRHSAAHNEIAISQDTHRLVAGYFDCINLGAQSLSGFALPLEIFKVVRESGARTRLDAAAQLTPLIGRKTETAKLMGLWEEAVQGVRHVVLVQGEAGIGKSRLLLTLKKRLADQPHAIRELRCFPEFSQSPFYPLIVMLEAIFCFANGDTPELKFDKLAKYLEAHYPATAQDTAPLLAQLLSLPLAGHYQAPGYSPQKQKELTIAILLGLLQELATKQPVLLIVEDLHWIDPSTLELLTLFVEQTGQEPILTALTARPEFIPPWKKTIETTLTLAPLVEDEVAEMIASLRADIPAATIRRIAERTDGVPLFVEEMAKIATTDNRTNIPATLHDLLAARMDNLGEAKYTAQLAATLGREFDLDLLRKISSYGPAALAHSLTALQDAGLIFQVNKTMVWTPPHQNGINVPNWSCDITS